MIRIVQDLAFQEMRPLSEKFQRKIWLKRKNMLIQKLVLLMKKTGWAKLNGIIHLVCTQHFPKN